jgi:hypothetical protein
MNRKTNLRNRLIGLSVAALVVAGCGKLTEEVRTSAQTAMDEAKAAGAEMYAAPEMNAAMDSLSAAQAEIANQDGKFALFRNYKEAERKLGVAQGLAATAKQTAAVNKEKARVEAEALFTQVGAMVDSTRALMTRAPSDKEGKKIIEAITTDLEGIAATLPEVRAMIDKQDYRGAAQMARGSMQRLEGINKEIQDAIDRKMGKKPAGM